MKATATNFLKFLQGTKQFIIPIYQRTYGNGGTCGRPIGIILTKSLMMSVGARVDDMGLGGPLDFVGECDSEANRRKSQGRGKPCPYHDTAWQARPCHGRGAPCGYPSTQLHFLYLSPTKSFMVARCRSDESSAHYE